MILFQNVNELLRIFISPCCIKTNGKHFVLLRFIHAINWKVPLRFGNRNHITLTNPDQCQKGDEQNRTQNTCFFADYPNFHIHLSFWFQYMSYFTQSYEKIPMSLSKSEYPVKLKETLWKGDENDTNRQYFDFKRRPANRLSRAGSFRALSADLRSLSARNGHGFQH